MVQDVAHLIGVARANETMVRRGNFAAGDIARAMSVAQEAFECLQLAVGQCLFPAPSRMMQQIEVNQLGPRLVGLQNV